MFDNQGTSQPEASQEEEKVNGDMASEWVELDDVQLATVVGGKNLCPTILTKPLTPYYGEDGPSGQWHPGSFWWIL
jgi:hypothetical protein